MQTANVEIWVLGNLETANSQQPTANILQAARNAWISAWMN